MGNTGKKRYFCGLSCSIGGSTSSVIDDEDQSGGRSPKGQRRRSKLVAFWSRFRVKKKTVPLSVLDAAATDDEADKILQAKTSNAKKKGFFQRFHKDKRMSHENPTQVNKCKQPLEGPHTSPIRHVSSKCKARAQPSTPLVQESDRTNHQQIRTRQIQIGSARQSSPSVSKSTMRKRGTNQKNSEAGLVVLAVTLATMLLGGRAIAILCMSAWFYAYPSLCTIAVKWEMKKMMDMSQEFLKEHTTCPREHTTSFKKR